MLLADGSVGTVKYIGTCANWPHIPGYTKKQYNDLMEQMKKKKGKDDIFKDDMDTSNNDNNNNDSNNDSSNVNSNQNESDNIGNNSNNNNNENSSDGGNSENGDDNENDIENDGAEQNKNQKKEKEKEVEIQDVAVIGLLLNKKNKNVQHNGVLFNHVYFDNPTSYCYFITKDQLSYANYDLGAGLEECPSYPHIDEHIKNNNIRFGRMAYMYDSQQRYGNMVRIMEVRGASCTVEGENVNRCEISTLKLANTDVIPCNVDNGLLNAPCIDTHILPKYGSLVQTRENEWGKVRFAGQMMDDDDYDDYSGSENGLGYSNNEKYYCGIELRYWSPNGGNGSYDGWQYFQCEDGYSKYVELDFIICQWNWDMEKVLWIGYYKSLLKIQTLKLVVHGVTNEQSKQICFLAFLPKAVLKHILSFLNYNHIGRDV